MDNMLEEVSRKIKGLYDDYNNAISRNAYSEALRLGKDILVQLLNITKEHVLNSAKSPSAKRVISDILNYHERSLAYIEGLEEAINDVPVLFSYEIKERALKVMSSSIQSLFSFLLGALAILVDLGGFREYVERGNERVPHLI